MVNKINVIFKYGSDTNITMTEPTPTCTKVDGSPAPAMHCGLQRLLLLLVVSSWFNVKPRVNIRWVWIYNRQILIMCCTSRSEYFTVADWNESDNCWDYIYRWELLEVKCRRLSGGQSRGWHLVSIWSGKRGLPILLPLQISTRGRKIYMEVEKRFEVLI